MASPFYLFRKYQRAFIAIAAVVAMFIFVLADPLMSWLQQSGGGGQRSAGTVVATWDGGSLNVQELENLARRRFKISEFLRNLVGMAAGLIEQEGGTPLPPTLPDFRLQNQSSRDVQVGCVTTRVLAEQAKKSGITVSDEVINHYLKEWGLRRMGDAEMGKLLGQIRLNEKALFSGIRELLMGNFYINSYALAMQGVLPEERWQDWKRINERIAVEVALLPAEKFISDVPEPSDSQLKEFYELHKDREGGLFQSVMGARLPSPEPGFREPRRAKLQYLLGSVDDWTLKYLNEVTEEEIADYYERNKRAQFVKSSTSMSADGLFDDDEATADEPKEDSSGATESSDDTPAEENEAPAAEGPGDGDSGRSSRPSPFQLAAFQEDAEAATDETESDRAEDERVGDDTDDTESDETSAAPESPAAPESDDEEPEEYEPLENVSEQIRRTLARDKAVVELQRVVDRTYAKLQSDYNPYGAEVVSARTEEKEIPAPPTSLADYKSIAKETGLASEETVLLSGMELAETFVGKAFDVQSRSEFVVQAMFGDQEMYEPYRAMDLDGNSYIVCKVEDVPSRVPEFDEVRNVVLAAWKQHEASKLAIAKAKELAKQAEESGENVATVARGAGFETVTTDMFSWLSFGTTPQEVRRGARLGDAPPLEAVGTEFMTEAFQLEPDKKVAVLNHDQTNAYVIQLERREQTDEELRKQFLAEANNWYGGRAMTSSRQQRAYYGLVQELTDRAGLKLDKLQEFLSVDSQ